MNDATEENKSSNKSRTWLERLTALLAREPKNREQLTAVLRDAEERDVLSSDVLSMIERILLVSEMQVREVMVPKAQMVVVRKDSKLDKILPIVIESGHSRFPVVDVTSKDVVGMLLAKDFLKYLFQQGQQDFSMNNIIRPVIFVPQSKRLDILLREFRVNRNHIAIVIDEYGHVAGLVTIEDVLEQIVGEIEDEYDIDEEDGHIKKLDDGVCIVKASTSIEEFNAYFHSGFSDDEFDTIGGIVLQNFGHLPKRGEIIKIHSLRFKVLHADNRRLYLLEVKVSKTKKRE
ncbi:MAG: magnesium/cobalt efflux protein [Gammaproteobacteria bacterium RIFCSPHIGHO2_12_FULL_37_14]|nr:MAG: magnesium/cobalt efflux protein [Gammaproteobacteria bacterium RIFCSPHIGHO2_12_FULL_37_14]